MTIPPDLLAILVCPACRGPLTLRDAPTPALRCAACALDYPVRDGIPILLADEAVAAP